MQIYAEIYSQSLLYTNSNTAELFIEESSDSSENIFLQNIPNNNGLSSYYIFAIEPLEVTTDVDSISITFPNEFRYLIPEDIKCYIFEGTEN